MRKIWDDKAWETYVAIQSTDKKRLKKINDLLKSAERDGEGNGLGNPEPLKGDLSGWWSRKINKKDRLVYKIENDAIMIAQCETHYDEH